MINRAEFKEWASSIETEYASCSLPKRKFSSTLYRLKFITTLSTGSYKVTFGDDTIYIGYSFDDASEVYNQLAAGAK